MNTIGDNNIFKIIARLIETGELSITHMFLLALLIIGFIGYIAYKILRGSRSNKNGKRSSSNIYGNSNWNDTKVMNNTFGSFVLPKNSNELLSTAHSGGGLVIHTEKTRNSADKLYYIDTDTHSLVFGNTGSGKTTRIVLPTILSLALAGEDMLITDPKGELYCYTINTLKNLNYETIVIDFTQFEKSMCFNPLQDIIDAVSAGDMSKAMICTNDFVQILVPENKHSEKIWTDGELATIGVGILSVVIENKDKPQYQNLLNVYNFLGTMAGSDKGKNDEGSSRIKQYLDNLPQDHPARLMFMIADVAPSRTRGSFFTSAMTTLRLFTDNSIAYLTSKTDFSLAAERKRAIFLIIPDEKTTYNSIATMLISMYYKALIAQARENAGTLKRRFNYILEEAGNCPAFPDIMAMLTVARSRRIRFMFFLQAIEQLRKLYDENTVASIYANCENIVLLKSNNERLLETISKRLGNYTANISSKSYSKGSTSKNISVMARPLMYPWELGELKAPDAVVIFERYKFKTHLPFIWQNTIYYILGFTKNKEKNQELLLKIDNSREKRKMEKIALSESYLTTKFNYSERKYDNEYYNRI